MNTCKSGPHAAFLTAVMVLLCGCGGSQSNIPTWPRYTFVCCTADDVNQVWHPGSTVELHWTVEPASPATDRTPHAVTLSAVLSGPYPDVATLKKGGGATNAVQGSVIRTDDRTSSPAPISTFILPSDLPPGYYNLEIRQDWGGGNYASGAAVIRVG